MKIPPQSISTEKTVLASIIIGGKLFADIYDRFKSDLFYDNKNRMIAMAIISVYKNNSPVDIVTISDQLRKSGDIDRGADEAYLSELSENTASSQNIGAHLEILESKYQLRKTIEIANDIANSAFAEDAVGEEIVRRAEGLYNRLSYDSFETLKEYDHKQSVADYLQLIEDAKKSGRIIRGINSNMPDLDKFISGWEAGKVYLVSGLEKLGKSRFVRSLASHWLNNNHGIAMFMLEEDEESIHECLLANRCVINTNVMATAGMNHEQIIKVFEEANKNYMNQPLHISVKSGMDPLYIKSVIQRQKSKMKKLGVELKFAIVDYIQRMTAAGEGHQMYEYIASTLANIARDEKICMIEISQMSANAEKNRKTPLHTQLRFGKVFKEAAHCIITFDDPERAGEKQDEGFDIEEGCKTLLAHIIQRKGMSDVTIPVRAQLQYSRFNDAI